MSVRCLRVIIDDRVFMKAWGATVSHSIVIGPLAALAMIVEKSWLRMKLLLIGCLAAYSFLWLIPAGSATKSYVNFQGRCRYWLWTDLPRSGVLDLRLLLPLDVLLEALWDDLPWLPRRKSATSPSVSVEVSRSLMFCHDQLIWTRVLSALGYGIVTLTLLELQLFYATSQEIKLEKSQNAIYSFQSDSLPSSVRYKQFCLLLWQRGRDIADNATWQWDLCGRIWLCVVEMRDENVRHKDHYLFGIILPDCLLDRVVRCFELSSSDVGWQMLDIRQSLNERRSCENLEGILRDGFSSLYWELLG